MKHLRSLSATACASISLFRTIPYPSVLRPGMESASARREDAAPPGVEPWVEEWGGGEPGGGAICSRSAPIIESVLPPSSASCNPRAAPLRPRDGPHSDETFCLRNPSAGGTTAEHASSPETAGATTAHDTCEFCASAFAETTSEADWTERPPCERRSKKALICVPQSLGDLCSARIDPHAGRH